MRSNTNIEKLNRVIGFLGMYAEMLAWTNCYIEERIGSRNELPIKSEILENMLTDCINMLNEVESSLREEDSD